MYAVAYLILSEMLSDIAITAGIEMRDELNVNNMKRKTSSSDEQSAVLFSLLRFAYFKFIERAHDT
jgi:hypothetical protein